MASRLPLLGRPCRPSPPGLPASPASQVPGVINCTPLPLLLCLTPWACLGPVISGEIVTGRGWHGALPPACSHTNQGSYLNRLGLCQHHYQGLSVLISWRQRWEPHPVGCWKLRPHPGKEAEAAPAAHTARLRSLPPGRGPGPPQGCQSGTCPAQGLAPGRGPPNSHCWNWPVRPRRQLPDSSVPPVSSAASLPDLATPAFWPHRTPEAGPWQSHFILFRYQGLNMGVLNH